MKKKSKELTLDGSYVHLKYQSALEKWIFGCTVVAGITAVIAFFNGRLDITALALLPALVTGSLAYGLDCHYFLDNDKQAICYVRKLFGIEHSWTVSSFTDVTVVKVRYGSDKVAVDVVCNGGQIFTLLHERRLKVANENGQRLAEHFGASFIEGREAFAAEVVRTAEGSLDYILLPDGDNSHIRFLGDVAYIAAPSPIPFAIQIAAIIFALLCLICINYAFWPILTILVLTSLCYSLAFHSSHTWARHVVDPVKKTIEFEKSFIGFHSRLLLGNFADVHSIEVSRATFSRGGVATSSKGTFVGYTIELILKNDLRLNICREPLRYQKSANDTAAAIAKALNAKLIEAQ